MKANRRIYLGIFLVSLATLTYEILLTRIFSVTMGYHFAFMAVSLAMFGMTVGAIIVYVKRDKFKQENLASHLAKNSLWFSLSIIISFLFHILLPFVHSFSVIGLLNIVFTYSLISVPFIFSGICISLILTRFSSQVNRLYAADLIGASLGCIIVILLLNYAGGPTSVLYTAFIAATASFFFADGRKLKKNVLSITIFLFVISAIHTFLVLDNNALLRVYWIRGEWKEKPLYEKWNSFSRVSIDGDSTKKEIPFGWGLSNVYDRNRKIQQLMLNIDAFSTTVLSKFDGNLNELVHLKYDVSNVVHYLRPNSDILIIGSGGGRDVLSSLCFGQKSILGIEINKDMISALNNEFGSFTGHLDKYPNVKFVGDEARSWIQRHPEKYDIIQVSVIDNWSATSSGAFVLTENSLYTLETWKLLISRLKDDGFLTVTRFYRSKPVEIYRLISISTEAMLQSGISNPREHLVVLKCYQQEREADRSATGTILLSRSPFKKNELQVIDSVSNFMQFTKVLTPVSVTDSSFAKIASANLSDKSFVNNFPIDITPPTDDKPFFFHLLKFSDLPKISFWKEWDMGFNVKAMSILAALTLTMLILSTGCIIIPLKLSSKNISMKDSKGLFVYFASIGFGFMFIEISQLQRLNIFLGHPIYSITVSLFTLLLSSGLGSFLGGKFISVDSRKKIMRGFAILLAVTFLFGAFTSGIISPFRELETYIRIIISVVILFPIGLMLGIAFPIGINAASVRNSAITPWLWGINGVTSVFASVISIIISMSYGISITYWTGFFCYAIAALVMNYTSKRKTSPL